MTLAQWLIDNPDVQALQNPEGSVYVYSRDPVLWHLSDYLVSSCVSGLSVVMVKRPEEQSNG